MSRVSSKESGVPWHPHLDWAVQSWHWEGGGVGMSYVSSHKFCFSLRSDIGLVGRVGAVWRLLNIGLIPLYKFNRDKNLDTFPSYILFDKECKGIPFLKLAKKLW